MKTFEQAALYWKLQRSNLSNLGKHNQTLIFWTIEKTAKQKLRLYLPGLPRVPLYPPRPRLPLYAEGVSVKSPALPGYRDFNLPRPIQTPLTPLQSTMTSKAEY